MASKGIPAKRASRRSNIEVPETGGFIPNARAEKKVEKAPIKPLNAAQKEYLSAMATAVLTIATGPAGTGKTWLCAATAAQALQDGTAQKLIITRPAVEAGESLGFLPGEKEEKFDPYLAPFKDVLIERLGVSQVEMMIKSGKIEAAPLAYMRGRSFKNAYVILDEAQNTTKAQMKMFLTRVGRDCKVIVNGDMTQKDIPGLSGLDDAIKRLKHLDSVYHVEFHSSDIVRSDFVGDVIRAYDKTI